MHRRRLRALPIALAVPLLVAGPATARSYRAYDLGAFIPSSVNASNQVAGVMTSVQPSGAAGPSYAALWADGALRRLPPVLGARDLGVDSAADIADDGTVVGTATATTGSATRRAPVVWLPGAGNAIDVGGGEGGFMLGIAPSGGVAVGWHYTNGGREPTVSIRATIARGKVTPADDAGTYQFLDVNDTGDILGFNPRATSDPYALLRAGQAIPVGLAHSLGADGSVVSVDVPGTSEVLIRRPDGTLVHTGIFQTTTPADASHGVTPTATQNGAFVGGQVTPTGGNAVLWKAGERTDLTPFLPTWNGKAPDGSQASDLSTKGAIVGSSMWRIDYIRTEQRGWLLVLQVRITGQVVEPSLPPASPARLAARAATRPVKGARVVLTPAGGAAVTLTTDAQGRFSADVPPGKVAITLPGRSGCVTAACTTTTTIDAQDDLALAVRLDPATKPATPTLPKGAIRVKRGAVPLTLRCRLVSAPCRTTATIRQKRKVLATAALTVKAGKLATRTLPLTKAGRAALASGATAKATLTLVTRTPTGRTTTTVSVRLRR